jgi:hypothetical protein
VGVGLLSDYTGDVKKVGNSSSVESASDWRILGYTVFLNAMLSWIYTRSANKSNNPDYLYRGNVYSDGSWIHWNQPPYAEHYAGGDRNSMPAIMGAMVFLSVLTAGRLVNGFDLFFSNIVLMKALYSMSYTNLWQVIIGDLVGSVIGFIPHWWEQRAYIMRIQEEKSRSSSSEGQSSTRGRGRY